MKRVLSMSEGRHLYQLYCFKGKRWNDVNTFSSDTSAFYRLLLSLKVYMLMNKSIFNNIHTHTHTHTHTHFCSSDPKNTLKYNIL